MIRFESIRTSKSTKLIISCLAINLIFAGVYPSAAWALPEGPTQPEFNSFTPIGASDMVDLSSGDFNYSIPVIDVGGYPLSLGYSSSTNFDTPSSWVGHGWDLSAGQINRSMRVIPDDFNGEDRITTQNAQKDNTTVTVGLNLNISLVGFDIPETPQTEGLSLGVGLAATYNSYTGMSMQPSFGPSFGIHKGFTSLINFAPSSTDGVTITPQVGFDGKKDRYGLGMSFNSFSNSLSVNGSIRSMDGNEKHENERIGGSLNTLDFRPAQFNPTYQLGYTNMAGSVNLALGATMFGVDLKPELYASISNQSLKREYKNKEHQAFGYNHNHLAGYTGMRDFSRSNDRTITAGISNLPVPQNTYDYYSISGQGISGSFRPQNAQIGFVTDPKVVNSSQDYSFSTELAGGNLFKVGGNLSGSYNDSWSGYWKGSKGNNAHQSLNSIEDPLTNGNTRPGNFKINYFKLIGENTLKNNPVSPNNFVASIGDKKPVYFKRSTGALTGQGSFRDIESGYTAGELNLNTTIPQVEGFVMDKTVPTSKTIVPVFVTDYMETNQYINDPNSSDNYGDLNKTYLPGSENGLTEPIAKSHHQAGFKVTDDGGAIYNYDLPLYTVNSSQISFGVSDNATKNFLNSQVAYSNQDNSPDNKRGRDHFYEKRTIDPYVHTSLLRSILSPDYRDKTDNGVSPDDLGSYTLFKYLKTNKIRPFRLPVEKNQGFYNEGTKSSLGDDKASITYGEKEQAFLQRVITKTHVAYFQLNNDSDPLTQRKDDLGAIDENGGVDTDMRSRYLSKIHLYTLAQAEKVGLLDSDISSFDPYDPSHVVKPLKTAHFEYDYSLQNNITGEGLPNSVAGNGKLTLKKVYFTYGNSEMGRYTPYTFGYNQHDDTSDSFKYHNLNKDVWGNYMPSDHNNYSLLGEPTNGEFPYTDQNNADVNVSKFLLSEISLPSGGEIKVNYEADDYAFVQDKTAMKMFKIAGTGKDALGITSNFNFPNEAKLYEGVSSVNDFLYLNLGNDINWGALSSNERLQLIESKHLQDIANEPIYFKILSNINNGNSRFKEFITGFVYLNELSEGNIIVNSATNECFLSLQVKSPVLNGASVEPVHPFSKAVWNYSNTYLKSIAFNGEDRYSGRLDPEQAARSLLDNMGAIFSMFSGPNRKLRGKGCGKYLYTDKSWLRLNDATGFKKGGGARVAAVLVDSNWDQMTSGQVNSEATSFYGQEYSYKTKEGTSSSGVAVNEPDQSEDNPLKVPLEDRSSRLASGANTTRLMDKFLAPMNSNYIIGPLMSDYYPSPQVTYSRVEVKNTKPNYVGNNTNLEISSRATGHVVNEFYTSKDFPVIEKNTVPDAAIDQDNNVTSFIKGLIGFPADLYSGERFIGTQGFYVETNDMNGKPKSQTVYAENDLGDSFITKSITEYQQTASGQLDNSSVFIDKSGQITVQEVGVEYDVVNDFRYASSETYTAYLDANLASFLIFIAPIGIPMGIPGGSFHETKTRIATTAKHVHRAGIMKSQTVIDNGSSITTENLAYDYYSRQSILKMVNNEFNDVIYNFDYPAYWLINEMGNKSINEGMEFKINDAQSGRYSFYKDIYNNENENIPLLINGDEIKLEGDMESYWVHDIVYGAGNDQTNFELIDDKGFALISSYNDMKSKVIRSAYDNKQAQSVASLSMSKNPIRNDDFSLKTELPNLFDEDYLIYNASAIEMKGLWEPDCECGYDQLPRDENGQIYFDSFDEEINPYFHNILGQYRPWKSRAFLTGREVTNPITGVNLRNDGFYKEFTPFYVFEDVPGADRKLAQPIYDELTQSSLFSLHNKWTYASEVSKVNPYGLELENKDALDRHSAAMYGFNKKFPTAVASNTEYRELAFDGFEDYDYIEHDDEHFAFAKSIYHTQNPNGTFTQNGTIQIDNHITDLEKHTGNYSMEVGNSNAVGLNKTIVECRTDVLENNADFEGLLNLVWNYAATNNIPQNGCINDQAIDAYLQNSLSQFIESIPAGDLKVCNVINTSDRFAFDLREINRFSFNTRDVVIETFIDSENSCDYNHWYVNNLSDINIRYELIADNNYGGINTLPEGYDSFVRMNTDCLYVIKYNLVNLEKIKCTDCTSFSPHQSYNYVVSAWVKEDIDRSNLNTPLVLRDAYPTTYEAASVEITFTDINGTQISTPSQFNFEPSGQIINGWQKVYGTFKVPNDANMMKVLLVNSSEIRSAFFDDIRIHPVNGSMKSFVYDDESFRLKAELDDNNYATFYEYDLEGNLIRIKKETSRGIMTIQESRQSLTKQIPAQ
jgi:hypothetical protein